MLFRIRNVFAWYHQPYWANSDHLILILHRNRAEPTTTTTKNPMKNRESIIKNQQLKNWNKNYIFLIRIIKWPHVDLLKSNQPNIKRPKTEPTKPSNVQFNIECNHKTCMDEKSFKVIRCHYISIIQVNSIIEVDEKYACPFRIIVNLLWFVCPLVRMICIGDNLSITTIVLIKIFFSSLDFRSFFLSGSGCDVPFHVISPMLTTSSLRY